MTPTTTFPADAGARLSWNRALVTGGAGFLGSHLCARLLDSGAEVDCLDDLSTGRAGNVAPLSDRPGFRFLERDIRDIRDIHGARDAPAPGREEALTGPYDLVLHLAGPTAPADATGRPREALDAGSLGTRNALAVADRDGARFLLVSSPEARAGDRAGDGDPVGPYSAYAEATRFSEALVAAHAAGGSNAGIVRVFATCGPRMRTDDGRTVSTLLGQALSGGPVTVAGDGDRTLPLCYVDDVADGVLLLAAGRSVRPVDLGGDDGPTVAQLARRIAALTGSGSPALADGAAGGPPPPRPATGFARELFGWVPKVTWQEGLERTVAAFLAGPGRAPAAVGRGGGGRSG
ncbi:NAD-dependent epimerase/dehydratase family protein [Streptomyces glaucus]|uniref:NAD-dependent epimerase/dehydratase family protein n=1 Tax=Streptomyces glaucus TaxID=284029 RepID=A0ABN3K2M0_9ACTN